METLGAEVRRFLADEIRSGSFEPRCDAWLSGHSPEFSGKLAQRGWIGLTWPRRYGGRERTYLERYAVLEELLAAGAPVAAHWVADRQTGPLLLRYGTEAQRERFLPAMARGECFFGIGMSEPDSGSDLASIRTAARAVPGGWRLKGTKVWTSHAHRSHYMITLVRTRPLGERKHEGMSQLIVDLKGEGVEVRPIRLMTGEPHFSEVVFHDAFVPEDMLVGEEGDGWEQVTSELAYERSGPERFLSTFPLLAALLRELAERDGPGAEAAGRLVARLWALRRLSMGVAAELQQGRDPAVAAALVKDRGTRFERSVPETARLLLPAERRSPKVARLLEEALLHGPGFTLRGGTNEILRGIIARSLKPSGPHPGAAGDLALVVETAEAVFGRPHADPWREVDRAGLLEISPDDLGTAAAAVQVSAYHAADIDFAERLLLPDPADRGRGALVRAIQMTGAMARAQDLSVTYASERRQFGQPLRRFQAIGHMLAEMAGELAEARATVAAAVANPDPLHVAAAKVMTGDAAGRVAALAHQVHGAIGFTQEHDLHRVTTRLWRWRDDYGTEAEWATELGRAVAGRDLWELTAG